MTIKETGNTRDGREGASGGIGRSSDAVPPRGAVVDPTILPSTDVRMLRAVPIVGPSVRELNDPRSNPAWREATMTRPPEPANPLTPDDHVDTSPESDGAIVLHMPSREGTRTVSPVNGATPAERRGDKRSAFVVYPESTPDTAPSDQDQKGDLQVIPGGRTDEKRLRPTTPAEREAEKFLDATLHSPGWQHLRRKSDPGTAKRVMEATGKRLASGEFEPDTRMQIAEAFLDEIVTTTDFRTRADALALLPKIPLDEDHAHQLQAALLDKVQEFGKQPPRNSSVIGLLNATEAVAAQLPHDRESGKRLISAWSAFGDTLTDPEERDALLEATVKIFTSRTAERYERTQEDVDWRNGAVIGVAQNSNTSINSLAKLFNMGSNTVATILKDAHQAGIDVGKGRVSQKEGSIVNRRQGRKPHLDQQSQEALLAGYNLLDTNGTPRYSLQDLAKQYKIHQNTVISIVARLGGEMRTKVPRTNKYDAQTERKNLPSNVQDALASLDSVVADHKDGPSKERLPEAVREARAKAEVALFKLGVPRPVMAKLLGLSLPTVYRDIGKLQEQDILPSRTVHAMRKGRPSEKGK